MNTVPQDLAGYQNIIMGFIQEGDILVHTPTRHKCWAPAASFHFDIEELEDVDVYRKMACPKAGDHDKDWKRVQDEAKLSSDGLWRGHQQPDGQTFWIPNITAVDLNKAKTDDSGKPPLATLPWKALRKVSRVQAYGHKKYGDFYNYKKGMEVTRQLGCAVRHIADYLDGIDLDKESGESHLAHAACRLLFALENIEDGTLKDDRFKNK
jgi:hypothetical protein